jgi:hypothetical protein
VVAEVDSEAKNDGSTIFVLNLPIAHNNRSEALAIATLKAGISTKEIERETALCKLQSARESMRKTANVTFDEELEFEN